MATTIDSNTNINVLFNKIEKSVDDSQPTYLGLICNGIRPHGGNRGRRVISPSSDRDHIIEHIDLEHELARINSERNNSRDVCPSWIVSELHNKREVQPMYIKYVQPTMSEQDELLQSRLAHVSRHFVGHTPGVYYKPNSTHQYLTETDVKDCTMDEIDQKHGRPTRTTLLRARLASDRIPINAYQQHRERIQRLNEMRANQVLVMDLNQLIEMQTQQKKHAFLCGARYNRGKYLDSKCIDTWGMYMLRDSPANTFVAPSLTKIIAKLETDDTPPAPPETPHDIRTVRISSAPPTLHTRPTPDIDMSQNASTDGPITPLNIKGMGVSKGTSTSPTWRGDTPKSVLPSVSGISVVKIKSPLPTSTDGVPGSPTSYRSMHNVSLEECVTKKSYLNRTPSISSLVGEPEKEIIKEKEPTPRRRRKHRKKPIMVDRSMNFPPTASEADSTDLMILGKITSEPRLLSVNKSPSGIKSATQSRENLNNLNNNNGDVDDRVTTPVKITGVDNLDFTDDGDYGNVLFRESTALESVDVQISDSENMMISASAVRLESRDSTQRDTVDKIKMRKGSATSVSRMDLKTPLDTRESSNLTAEEWRGVANVEAEVLFMTENSSEMELSKAMEISQKEINVKLTENTTKNRFVNIPQSEMEISQPEVGQDSTEISQKVSLDSMEKPQNEINKTEDENVSIITDALPELLESSENIAIDTDTKPSEVIEDYNMDKETNKLDNVYENTQNFDVSTSEVAPTDLAEIYDNESVSDMSETDVTTTISVDISHKS